MNDFEVILSVALKKPRRGVVHPGACRRYRQLPAQTN
jgi:hypothetical protein